jgi:GT2 family glycosyltransferase/glycosyltransferase involved in cell wall biosynthesis
MPPHSDLIRVVFASGPADLNRAVIERVAAMDPPLPLFVVGEFEPHRGEWIPWHVLRGTRENMASMQAALGARRIRTAAVVLATGTRYGKLRLLAWKLAPGAVVGYDESLREIRGVGFIGHGWRRMSDAFASPRAQKWLRLFAHPAEAELPVRTRLAQLYGLAADRFRSTVQESAMPGLAPLQAGVTVVVPSRDGKELLATMLTALAPQVLQGEIIVCDNGSSDGTADWLATHHPAVRVIGSPTPLSFARAVNGGIREARFSHVLLLNNDMIVAPGFVEALEAAFAQIPDLYCATAQIFFPPGIRREETGKAVWRREGPRDFPVRCDEPLPAEDLTPVLYGSGGCSLFDTVKLREMGGVSEVYDPAYVEDLDFGFRAWKRGWPSVYCAGAKVEHRHRATTARFFTTRQLDFFVERNYLRFLLHAVASPALFRRLWAEAIRRLQLLAMEGNAAAVDTLRDIPSTGSRPLPATGHLSEEEILALGCGDIASFPGRAPERPESIVIASPYLPFPLSHGGAVRIYNLMRYAAEEQGQILVVFADNLVPPPVELLDICREVVVVRRHGSHYRRTTDRPDTVEEFDSLTFRACLKQTIRRWHPALAQLEFTQMAQYADACAPARTVLVEHDITFDLQEQLLRTSPESGAARWEQEGQLVKWRAFETAAWRDVDAVVTMSSHDAARVHNAKRVVCLPNGVDCARFQPDSSSSEDRRLLFIGAFRHLPNLLALEFFLNQVWPLLGPGWTLHVIAGADHAYFLDFYRDRVHLELAQQGVEVEGFVADVRGAYRKAGIVLAPLTASAGTNIKVLEAMAMGRVVVSTVAGVNGLDITAGKDVTVTDSAAEMAGVIQRLSADPAFRARIEAEARATACRFDWRLISRHQSELYGSLAL